MGPRLKFSGPENQKASFSVAVVCVSLSVSVEEKKKKTICWERTIMYFPISKFVDSTRIDTIHQCSDFRAMSCQTCFVCNEMWKTDM